MEQLASDTSSFEGGPPFSAEPHGWGISMSVSGEFQRARSPRCNAVEPWPSCPRFKAQETPSSEASIRSQTPRGAPDGNRRFCLLHGPVDYAARHLHGPVT